MVVGPGSRDWIRWSRLLHGQPSRPTAAGCASPPSSGPGVEASTSPEPTERPMSPVHVAQAG